MKKKIQRKSASLIEGADFYLENGRYVFTEHYLRKRGYCCRSGCRHCPYGFRKNAPGRRDEGKKKSID